MNIKKLFARELQSLPEEVKKRNDAEEVQATIRFRGDHYHHIMNDDDEVAKGFLEEQALELGMDLYADRGKEPPEKIIFHNRQAIGDILMFTCGVRDFKKAFPNTRVGVMSTAMHIWDHNPYVDHTFRDQRFIEKIGPGFLTNKSNSSDLHMANAFRIDIENKLGVKIPQGPIRPDIWMTEEEYKRPPLIEGPYWVFIYGGEPGWPSKQYHRWQEVINLLREDIQIVQLGVSKHPYPKLNGVVDYVGKTEHRDTGIRDLFNIFLHSQGSIGLVSMHMHLSAAFGNPCVVVDGAREPASFTNYFGHQYLQTNGTLPCGLHTSCWACKLEGCKNLVEPETTTPGHNTKKVPKCVDILEPEEIAEAVRKYYKGGRLEYGKKVPNTFFKNITKEKKIFSAPKPDAVDSEFLEKWGFKWGSGSVTDRDWIFIKDLFKEYKIKSVLEFGAGLSTLLFGTLVDKVLTYETMEGWVKKIAGMADSNKHEFVIWDGLNVKFPATYDPDTKFDFAFVDGPAGGENREWSTKFASEHADLIIVHDAGRKPEKMWQDKYLAQDFELVAKSGHRCHFWQKKSTIEKPVIDESKPLVRVVTTCRGWGGSERSTCEIMGMLLERDFNVELVSTGPICGEFMNNIPKGVIKRPWEYIQEPADILFLYASDTIWNYHTEQWSIMNNVAAKRKVMVLNYKLGKAGQVKWTRGWDKYLFLNSTHESELIKRIPDAVTLPLPPPTDLTKFFAVEPIYEYPLKLIRHSSQGDNKYPDYTNQMITDIMRIDSAIEFHFMPARSDCMTHPQVYKYPKNQPPVYEFLKNGNCFFYHLPPGYTEGGPKVVMEAMAAGLPCIVDNHSGMKDRVTDETGWKCNTYADFIDVIKEIVDDPKILEVKGKAARQRALTEFDRQRWVEEIIK